MSSSYEQVNFITSFGFSKKWRRQFLYPLQKTEKEIKIIDLMTGMGETWNGVEKYFPNAEFYALDFSEGMLKYAYSKNKNKFNNKVKLLNQNLLENQLPDQHFDIVISAFGLKTFNQEQLKIVAEEIKRILKPEGEFSLIEVSKPANYLLRLLYKIHLKYIVPICGKLLLGSSNEYKMLWYYTNFYKNSDATAEIFKTAGLEIKKETYFLGCATGISGKKNKN